MGEDEVQSSGTQLLQRDRRGGIDNHPGHVITHVVLGATPVPFQKLLEFLPRGRLMPSAAAFLEPPAPEGVVGGPALDEEEAGGGGGGEVAEAVEVGPTGEWGVEEDAEAEAELGGCDLPDGVV